MDSPLIDLGDDVIAIRDTIRKFIYREVIPREHEIEEQALVPADIVQQMRELGLFGLTIPEEYGGMGLDSLAYAVVSGEISKANSAVRTYITVNNSIGQKSILLGGTEAQRREYLPRMARGEFLVSFALTEPGAGSDAQAIQTSAVRRGDKWVLNGRKHYISHAHRAELFTVFAVTDKDKRSRGGISAFLVPKGSPGLSLGKQQEMMGGRGSHPGEVIFEDCEVPAENLLGELGFGFRLIQACLNDGRLNLAACAVGAAERLLEMGTEYAKLRHAFGAPIGANQGIQWMLAGLRHRARQGRREERRQGVRDGQALRHRDGEPGGGPRAADPRRRGLHQGAAHRALLSRRANAHHRRGNERDPAGHHRHAGPRAASRLTL